MSAVRYTPSQLAAVREAEEALRTQLADKPRRLEHSLSVARTAEDLATTYGVDPFEARIAGTLHDWCKALSPDEQRRLCRERGIAFSVDLDLVTPLLHGPLAASLLPERFGWVTPAIAQSIARHTIGAPDMTPLDMVVFVADYVEPLRGATPAIERSRSLVGKASLHDLCLDVAVGSIAFVLETNRYLYPATIDTYNALVLARA
ncbi:MAG: bis(5'-nucleosyl)-tetraphosphatase (symmetrical) YqeK [Atopobiaceae bacterium]|nr:bis(5'-nucleosyl)-tetraphosphatase (symmetrical) YqeK [Atopobiaceae bacterium]